ncbi:hypothetical protein Ancab_020775 [Ancistrocladus abbreviatus]
MSTPQPSVDFSGVISESKRIINAHSRHFLALSVLFLLPLSFSITVFPTLHATFTARQPNRIETLLRLMSTFSNDQDHQQPIISSKTLIFSILFTIFILFLSLSALGSITYSVFHGFYGRPVKLISAFKSLSSSFVLLLATAISAQLVVSLIFGVFGLFGFLGVKGIELIGVQISYDSPYFIGFLLIWAAVFGLVLMYFAVNWALVSVIVVLESKWGFEAMARSRNLMEGMRKVGLSLVMFFGVFVVLLFWISMISDQDSDANDNWWKSWAFIVQIVATSAVLTLLLLHNIAASTVLYMYCKALHGELADEIAKEFAREYVSLPFDDEKVPHVVSVAPH